MKLNVFETIAIAATALIVIITITTNIINKQINTHKPLEIYINSTEDKNLLENIRTRSKKYNAYEDLYKSDQLTLVYSYYTDSKKSDRDEDFHQELTKKLEENGIKINTVTYKNWEDDSLEVSLKNRQYIDETASCGIDNKEESMLKKYIEDAQLCIKNVCLVDVKRNKYVLISPNVDYTIETIKKYPNI